jgi:PEP-CTERM motif
MSIRRLFLSRACCSVAVGLTFAAAPAAAQVTAPSLYTTGLQVQGEAVGTEFADWAAAGVTNAEMDPADNTGFLDVANVQIANDEEFIYVHVTTHGASTSLANLFLAFDTDQNATTGFDVFGLGVVGSEFGYQTDFPFAQSTGMFNTGAPIGGGPLGNGGALIYPFWTDAGAPQGAEIEWAVPRDVLVSGMPVFANDSLNLAVYTTDGLGDITQSISYTLAAPPLDDGDYNEDGVVDAADYVVWRRDDGTPAKYQVWRENFGTMPGGGSLVSISAVPEPATGIWLAGMGIAVLVLGRCRLA